MAENNSIENIRPPFSAYDFFGHLIPGLTFFVCLYVFELGVQEKNLNQDAFFSKYRLHSLLAQTQPTGGEGALRYAGFMGVAVLFVYAISHVISSISSFFIDRLLIYKGFGYPYRFLLLGESDKTLSSSEDIKRQYYRGIFFWGNFCLLTTYLLKVVLGVFLNRYWFGSAAGIWFVFFGLPILTRWIIGGLHHARVKEKGQLLLLPEKQPSMRQRAFSRLRIETETPEAKDRFRKIAHAFAGGFNGPSHTIQKVLRTDNPLEKSVADKYREVFHTRFKMHPVEAESSNYWFSLFYVTEHSPRISKMISNWFHQYSFARNMATAFYMAFVFCVIFVGFSFASVPGLSVSERAWLMVTPLAFFLMSLLMLVRFYYIYVAYYSRSLYRAFVFLQGAKQNNAVEKGPDADVVSDE